MNHRIRTLLLAVAAVSAIATPVLAETVCTVNAPEIRLRKSPSKKAHVVAVLKKNDQVSAVGACSGGWVKVTSTDGRISGYVGGWALSPEAPKAAAAPAAPVAAAKPEAARVEKTILVTAPREVPSNEKLAVQITELRLNVIGIERDMEKMSKEIQQIKVNMVRKKGHKRQTKKG